MKDLILNDKGHYIDKNTNEHFKGHVTKDLIVGDQFQLIDSHGKKVTAKITKNEVQPNGSVVVRGVIIG